MIRNEPVHYEWPNEIEPPIYFANSQWAVTEYGLECLTYYYPIEHSRLCETVSRNKGTYDWIYHMPGKVWCDMNQFLEAFMFALKHHKPKGRSKMDLAKSVSIAAGKFEVFKEYDKARALIAFAESKGLHCD